MEYLFDLTIGKLITNTKIEFEKSSYPKYIMVTIRTISRLIPLEPLSVFFDDEKRMWHDKLSNSKVIKK
jgi:hypothetical protein